MKLLLLLLLTFPAWCQVTQTEITYGRKDGLAQTLFRLTPSRPNGRGIVSIVSSGWRSSATAVPAYADDARLLLSRGYTVFLVVHASVPKYSILEIVPDIRRAVRFVRYHAGEYGIDPEKIGLTGSSAGGHLALLAALAGAPGKPTDTDPVEREAARVPSVACFYPPTSFIDFGGPGETPFLDPAFLRKYNRSAAFDFREWSDSTGTFLPITDGRRRRSLLRDLSPVYLVSSDDPPVLLIHGDADPLVPMQQSRLLADRLEKVGVPVALRLRPGKGHGWNPTEEDMQQVADWFDRYLLP